ncbi:MAG: guanylate kinase, partial [Opitutales bacterium]|nr:guanylate kinase [Opitutales bacterium]
GIGNGDFYEYAKVHDRYYGTSKNAINDTQGGDKILIIDVQGAATWRKIAQENPQIKSRLTTIFVAPDNEQELRKRLLGRNTESQEEIDRRMQTAIEEFKQADKFDIRIQSKSKDEDYNALREIYLNLKSKNS